MSTMEARGEKKGHHEHRRDIIRVEEGDQGKGGKRDWEMKLIKHVICMSKYATMKLTILYN